MAYHFIALRTRLPGLVLAMTVLLLVACADSDTPEIVPAGAELSEPQDTLPHTNQQQAALPDLTGWAELTTQHCPSRLSEFSTRIDALSAAAAQVPGAPTHDILEHAQTAWQDALRAWTAAHWCIADALPGSNRADHQNRMALVSSAPALAGFIDAVPGHEDSGIVHDENVPMTLDGLLSQHQITDDGEVAVGLYALEILLFGIVHRNRADFGDPESANEHHTTRRSQMLLLLSEHLSEMALAWQAYWDNHAPGPAEARASLMTHQARTAFAQLAALSSRLEAGQSGLALNREHDAIQAAAWLEASLPWWRAEATEQLVEAAGLPLDTWQSVGSELNAFNADAPNWALLSEHGQRAVTLLDQLMVELPAVSLPAF